MSSNSLVLLGAHATLVDTGHCTHAQQLQDLLSFSLGNTPLHAILNTHLHSDHCGGNAHLQACFPEVDIHIPSGQWQDVMMWERLDQINAGIGQTCPAFMATHPMLPNTEVCINGRVWQIHAAPGHDMDAIVLFAPKEKILISGDAFWQNGFGVVFPELCEKNGFMFVRQTLSLVEELAPAIVVPGHGPLFTQVQDSLNLAHQKLDHFEGKPLSHAKYASNVFIKFKLMQEQQMTVAALTSWALKCPVLVKTQEIFFPESSFPEWLEHIILDLSRKKSISVKQDLLLNL